MTPGASAGEYALGREEQHPQVVDITKGAVHPCQLNPPPQYSDHREGVEVVEAPHL